MSPISETLFTEVKYTLSKLIEDIEMGEIGLPDIQRPFVWSNTKVRDLFDSMYKGYPVGYLLFWVNGYDNGHRQIGAHAKQKVPRLLIVDGQQRLTSLFAVIKSLPVLRKNYATEKIRIAFNPLEQSFEVADAAIARDPEWIPDISEIWASGSPGYRRLVRDFISKLAQSRPLADGEEDRIWEATDRLLNLQNYPFTAMELSYSLSEEQVSDIFVRINSKGTSLNQADFILTLMSVYWDEGRAALERFCADSRTPSNNGPSPYNHFIQPYPDQLLRVDVALAFRRARLQHVYSILRGKDLDTGEFSDERRLQQFESLAEAQQHVTDLQNWHEFFKVLMRAGYRSSSMITSDIALLYSYALYLIGKHDLAVDSYVLRNVIARWYFMASMTGRYSASPESAMETDLARLRSVDDPRAFVEILDRVVMDTLTDDYWGITLPNALATPSARTPSLFAYYAALNLLDARALFSKIKIADLLDPSINAPKSGVERHHLFPRGYLQRIGISEIREINQVANYAWVEWADNISISDSPPSEYLPNYSQRMPQDELERMCYWHALPEGWEQMPYDAFLEERRRAMARVIRDAFRTLWE
jgi:hypothetical protein